MLRILITLSIIISLSFTGFGQEIDKVSVLDVTVRKMNSTKKVDIGSSEQTIVSAFGQPNSMTLHDYEEQGVTAKFYIYIWLKLLLFRIQIL